MPELPLSEAAPFTCLPDDETEGRSEPTRLHDSVQACNNAACSAHPRSLG